MVEVVENHLNEIVEVCKLMQLQSLYLIGSGARKNDFTESSDLDFMYKMITNETGAPTSKFDMFDLMWKLEEITGRKVDLVYSEGIRNKYFLKSIMEDRIKIYEA